MVRDYKSSHQCRGCSFWFEGPWSEATTDEARADIQRQMDRGECDDCRRKREMEDVSDD